MPLVAFCARGAAFGAFVQAHTGPAPGAWKATGSEDTLLSQTQAMWSTGMACMHDTVARKQHAVERQWRGTACNATNGLGALAPSPFVISRASQEIT